MTARRHITPDGAEIVITAHEHPPGEYVDGTTTSTTWTATWHLDPDPGEEYGDVLGALADPEDRTSWRAVWGSRRMALSVGHDAARAALSGESADPGWAGALLAGYGRPDRDLAA